MSINIHDNPNSFKNWKDASRHAYGILHQLIKDTSISINDDLNGFKNWKDSTKHIYIILHQLSSFDINDNPNDFKNWKEAAIHIYSILNRLVDSSSFINTKSLAFDGVDDYVDTGYTIIAGTDLSVSFWIKTSASTPYTEEYPVVCHALWGTGSSLGRTAQAGTTSRYNKIGSTFGTTQLNDGNWHHVVWTFNNTTNAVNAYVDGNATPDVTGTFTGNYGYDFYIGAFTDSVGAASLWFDGNVDEVAIWNSDQTSNVTTIYNSGTPTDLSTLSTPPIAWWRMGDNSTYQAPQILMPENTNKDKVSNYSMAFDGADDYVNTGSSSQDGASTLTISAWFNTSYDNWQYFFGDNSIKLFLKQNYPDRVDFTFNGSVDYRSTNFTITLGTWNHVALVFDGSLVQADRLKIYLNNSLLTNDLSGTPDTTFVANNNFMLGRAGTYSASEWNGSLDEISVFSTAKDVSGIATLWNSGTPGDLTSLSPVNWWKLGEEATFVYNVNPDGTWTIPDQVGSNNGTSNNQMVDSARVGTAPSSSNNAVSFNMVEADIETDVPT